MTASSDIAALLAEYGLDRHGDSWLKALGAVRRGQVEQVLAEVPGRFRLDRLLALVSPAAGEFLEPMALQARDLTRQRFGKTVALYAPMYVSNVCENRCLYCGFNRDTDAVRRRLTLDEAVAEADLIRAEGFTDLLLVSSEDRHHVTVDYLGALARRLRGGFSSISIETHQLTHAEYRALSEAGLEGVTLYQETYDRTAYSRFHKAGPKADYDRRLAAPDAACGAGLRRMGLGVLLGLADWRVETLALAAHAHYLMKRYWRTQVSFSFPRLRPAQDVSGLQFDHLVTDRDLVQMILALRLCFSDAGMVLSTREGPELRDHLVHLGITRMSAGSKTSPGGYSQPLGSLEQFEVHDTRSPLQVAEMLRAGGLDPVWKDFDKAFSGV